ncbi:MAG: arylsulfatase [Verrucomicrobiae bacterium]|nr:arylsulfatase [Verrucomicrobiae bacterium]
MSNSLLLLSRHWLTAILIMVSPTLGLAENANHETHPNVLFILADDLGYGDLSCYGATKVSTPNIDRLAKEGRKFMDAHSPCSVCTPSRYNLITGRYAWRTWVGGSTLWSNDPMLIDPDRYTLADLFKEQGYVTACLGKWHLGFGQPGTAGWDDVLGPDYNRDLKPGPLEVGFDYFWGFPHVGQFPHFLIENHRVIGLDPNDPIRITPDKRPGFELDYLHRPRSGLAAALGWEGGEATRYEHEELADLLTERAVRWLDDYEDEKPFFLYLAHRNIHGPLKPASRFLGSSEIGVYGDFLNEFDHSIGDVLAALDRNGFTEETLVIFSSDNGGVLQYRPIDHPEVEGHPINGQLRGQKTFVYEGGVRVPLIARWPGKIPVGSRDDDTLLALTDTLATFAEFFGKTLPEDAAEDSFSFLGALLDREQTTPKRESLVMDSYREMMAIRRGSWKLILGQTGGGANAIKKPDPEKPPGQLYHLGDDLAESVNRYGERPELVAELTAELRRIQDGGRSRPRQHP